MITAVSAAMRELPATMITKRPRTADFALWSAAGETALGLKPGDFLYSDSNNRAGANDPALEASPVAKFIIEMMGGTTTWSGTASDLLSRLKPAAGIGDKDKAPYGWPKDGTRLSGILNRLAPNLRQVGIDLQSGRTGRRHWRPRAVTR